MLRQSWVVCIAFALLYTGCFRTCDCFDEPEFSFSIEVDFKSYKTGMSIKEFLELDSAKKSKYYKIEVMEMDSSIHLMNFQWLGNGKSDTSGFDSTVFFNVWSADVIKQVTISIDTIHLKHTFTDFDVQGFSKGTRNCKCFTATNKSMRMDDSVTLGGFISFSR